MADGGNSPGYDMALETNLKVVEAANSMIPTKNPPGPFQLTWDSLKQNYRVPRWFIEAKFGLFMHWGLYSIPAHHNECEPLALHRIPNAPNTILPWGGG